jgi:hypothetical protein
VANALVKFDAGTGAGSGAPDRYTFPETVLLEDFAMETGTADTTRIMITVNGSSTSNILRYTAHLTTLNNRPRLSIVIPQGAQLGAVQLA